MDRSATKRKGRGGKRPGAGRPPGTKNTLPYGSVGALKALRYRVPAGTPEPLADLAGDALETVAAILRGEVYDPTMAQALLKTAAYARTEVCGPLAQKLEHTGKDGGPVVVEVVEYVDEPEPEGGQ